MTSSQATIKLGELQISLYRSNPPVYIRAFTGGSGIQAIIGTYYNNMVRKGLIKPLEAMDDGYKAEIKADGLEYSGGKLDVTGVMNMIKLIHILAQNT